MNPLSKKEYLELKREIEPIQKLAMHDDGDGISSGVLFTSLFKTKEVWCPEDFGVWSIKGLKNSNGEIVYPPDACVDMVPQDPNWEGKICIDHHPDHLPENLRKYKLIFGNVPAAVIIYKVFKPFIPRSQRWKVVVGAVGDGQPEVVPPEIWREYPILLERTVTTYSRYGNLQTAKFPIFLRLSAPINAACKIPGKWIIAFNVLRNARSPLDILEDPALKSAKEFVEEEHKNIIQSSNAIELRSGIKIWRFSSELKLERTLAYELEQTDKVTTIAVNEKTGRGSIRGVLATLVYEHLKASGFKASGHPGFGGLRLKKDQTVDDLIDCLRKLKV